MEPDEILLTELGALSTRVDQGFRDVHSRLDVSLTKCVQDCPKVFATKIELSTMRIFVWAACIASLVIAAVVIVINGQIAVLAFERVLKLL
jgi:hypothetical protein